MQPRYGFGPLLTEGADLLALMVGLQDGWSCRSAGC